MLNTCTLMVSLGREATLSQETEWLYVAEVRTSAFNVEFWISLGSHTQKQASWFTSQSSPDMLPWPEKKKKY